MIIWLASYPKSGNTWMRSIISALLYSHDGDFNFNLLRKIDQFPEKKHFKDLVKDFGNFNEIKRNWILAQDKINLDGEVIGINTAIVSQTGGSIGLGFAIPANSANKIVQQLKDFGKTKRGWLGVQIQPVTSDFAESLGLPDQKGAFISNVNPNGPSKTAGLEPGDVILSVYLGPAKKYAFLEHRSIPEATFTTTLDGISYMGVQLKLRRPQDYNPEVF